MADRRLASVFGSLLAAAAVALVAPLTAAGQGMPTVRAQFSGGRFVWNPETITVPVGTTVTWVSDMAAHTVTSTDNGPLNSPLFTPGQSYQYRFTTPGTYNYTCTVHPNQNGRVVVTAAAVQQPPAQQPGPGAGPQQPGPGAGPQQPGPGAGMQQPGPGAGPQQPGPGVGPQQPPAARPPAQAPAVPQFGGPNTLEWPPVFSGEIQATIGNATVILGLVGNRTLREHAFVDVRWALPTSVRVVNSGAGNPDTHRGKLQGLSAAQQQIGWINHYVRQGQVQGPFYIIIDNAGGRAFSAYSWLWFSTASDERLPGSSPAAPVLRRNGNYTSRGVQAGGAPLAWSAEFNTAAGGAGLPGIGGGR